MLELSQFKPISSIPDKEYIYGHTEAGHIQLTPIEINGEKHWQAKHLENKVKLATGSSRGQALYNAVDALNDKVAKCKNFIEWGK